MNTLKKLVSGTVPSMVLGVLVLGSVAAPVRAGTPFDQLLPDVSMLVSQVGEYIAAEVKSQLSKAVSAPRAPRVRVSPSVEIIESAAVTVTATRLPATDESVDMEVVRTAQVSF